MQTNQLWPVASHTAGPATEREAEADVTDSGARETHLEAVLAVVRLYPGLPASVIAAKAEMDVVECRRRLNDGLRLGLLVPGAPVRLPGERSQQTWFPVTGDRQQRMFE